MANQIFYWTVLILCAAYILRRGGAPERVGIAILVVGSLASTAAATADYGARFQSVEAGMFAVDVAVLAAYLVLAIKAERFWPLWVTGFHSVGVATHGAMLVSPDVVPWAYAVGQALWGYPMLLAQVIGTRRHQQRLAQFGADRSWTSSSARSGRTRPPSGPKA